MIANKVEFQQAEYLFTNFRYRHVIKVFRSYGPNRHTNWRKHYKDIAFPCIQVEKMDKEFTQMILHNNSHEKPEYTVSGNIIKMGTVVLI